jgi:hypothetical protein
MVAPRISGGEAVVKNPRDLLACAHSQVERWRPAGWPGCVSLPNRQTLECR